jgi:hypothetical protein
MAMAATAKGRAKTVWLNRTNESHLLRRESIWYQAAGTQTSNIQCFMAGAG